MDARTALRPVIDRYLAAYEARDATGRAASHLAPTGLNDFAADLTGVPT